MGIIYRVNDQITAEELAHIFKASGIRRPADDLPRIQRMIDHADILITAWDGKQAIGVARALTDYSYCCYLSDLAVDQAYQKQGIGKQLIDVLKQQLNDETSLLLLSAPEAMEYYPKIGFHRAGNAYLIPRIR